MVAGRNVRTPAAFLGVVYSGRAYAPIDAKLPEQRIFKILKTLQPAAILVDRENKEAACRRKNTGFRIYAGTASGDRGIKRACD